MAEERTWTHKLWIARVGAVLSFALSGWNVVTAITTGQLMFVSAAATWGISGYVWALCALIAKSALPTARRLDDYERSRR